MPSALALCGDAFAATCDGREVVANASPQSARPSQMAERKKMNFVHPAQPVHGCEKGGSAVVSVWGGVGVGCVGCGGRSAGFPHDQTPHMPNAHQPLSTF